MKLSLERILQILALLGILYLGFATYYDVQSLKESVKELQQYNNYNLMLMFMNGATKE